MWLNPDTTVDDIADYFGTTTAAVYNAVKRWNLPMRRQFRKIDDDKLAALWDTDLQTKEIAEKLGCSLQAVYRKARILDLPRPRPVKRGPEPYAAPDEEAETEAARPRFAAPPVVTAELLAGRPPGPWTEREDGLILATQGRYQEVAKLADRWQVESRRIIARYHALARRP